MADDTHSQLTYSPEMSLTEFNKTFEFWAMGLSKKLTGRQMGARYILCFPLGLRGTLMKIHGDTPRGRDQNGVGFWRRYRDACPQHIRRWYGGSRDDEAEEKFSHPNTFLKEEPFAQFEFRFRMALTEHEAARARTGRSAFTERDRIDALEKRVTSIYLAAMCNSRTPITTLDQAMNVCREFEVGQRKTQKHALQAANRALNPHAAQIVTYNPYSNTRVTLHPSGAQTAHVVSPPSSYLGVPQAESLAPAQVRNAPDYKVQAEGKFVTRGWMDPTTLSETIREQQQSMGQQLREEFQKVLEERLTEQRLLLQKDQEERERKAPVSQALAPNPSPSQAQNTQNPQSNQQNSGNQQNMGSNSGNHGSWNNNNNSGQNRYHPYGGHGHGYQGQNYGGHGYQSQNYGGHGYGGHGGHGWGGHGNGGHFSRGHGSRYSGYRSYNPGPCWNWQQYGYCSWGRGCRFSHDGPAGQVQQNNAQQNNDQPPQQNNNPPSGAPAMEDLKAVVSSSVNAAVDRAVALLSRIERPEHRVHPDRQAQVEIPNRVVAPGPGG